MNHKWIAVTAMVLASLFAVGPADAGGRGGSHSGGGHGGGHSGGHGSSYSSGQHAGGGHKGSSHAGAVQAGTGQAWKNHAGAGQLRSRHTGSRYPGARGPVATTGVHRDKHGRIGRSAAAKGEFMRSHPCPSTGKTYGACRGYVVDHVTPLKRGGADAPYNMQWQTAAAARAKDRTE